MLSSRLYFLGVALFRLRRTVSQEKRRRGRVIKIFRGKKLYSFVEFGLRVSFGFFSAVRYVYTTNKTRSPPPRVYYEGMKTSHITRLLLPPLLRFYFFFRFTPARIAVAVIFLTEVLAINVVSLSPRTSEERKACV